MTEHRHIWCVDVSQSPYWRGRTGHLHGAWCSCGLVALGPDGLRWVDPAAYEQLVDPDGLQRAFIAATGL